MSTLDTSALGILAARVMEQASEAFEDECVVRCAAVVVEVDSGDDLHFLVACTDDRSWTQIAFLKEGLRTLKNARYDAEVDDE